MAVQTNRSSDKVIIRLPDGMRDRIKHVAEANNRSMNAEIVATLEDKYPEEDSLDRTADAVIELLTSKVPRNAFGADLEERIRNILVENMPTWGVRVNNSSAVITPDFTLQNPETGEETPIEVKQAKGRGLRLQKPSKDHTTAVERRSEKPAPTPRLLKRTPEE